MQCASYHSLATDAIISYQQKPPAKLMARKWLLYPNRSSKISQFNNLHLTRYRIYDIFKNEKCTSAGSEIAKNINQSLGLK